MKRIVRIVIISIAVLLVYSTFSRVDAAEASISASKTDATVGDSITISVSMNAAAWNTKVTGAVNQNFAGNSDDGENTKKTETVTFKPTKAGSYTVYLGGDVSDGSTNATKDVSGKITINVAEKSSQEKSNNKSNDTNQTSQTKEPSFSETSKTSYATGNTNVRKSYSTDSQAIGQLNAGDSIKVLAVGSNGWSKVSYNGTTGYIKTSLLSDNKVEKKEENNEDNKEQSDGLSLKTLQTTPSGLFPEFKPETTEYTLKVGLNVEKVEVIAAPNKESASVKVSGNDKLTDGENTIKIDVTGEDGSKKTYTIKVTKENLSKAKLKSLSVSGCILSPKFSSDVFEYKINSIDPKTKKLDINATASDSSDTVQISENANNLQTGSNVITITVSSKDGSDKNVYKITVNKNASVTGTTSDKKDKIMYALIAIGVVVVVLVIMIVSSKIRKRKYSDYDEDENDDYEEDGLYGFKTNAEKNQYNKEGIYAKYDIEDDVGEKEDKIYRSYEDESDTYKNKSKAYQSYDNSSFDEETKNQNTEQVYSASLPNNNLDNSYESSISSSNSDLFDGEVYSRSSDLFKNDGIYERPVESPTTASTAFDNKEKIRNEYLNGFSKNNSIDENVNPYADLYGSKNNLKGNNNEIGENLYKNDFSSYNVSNTETDEGDYRPRRSRGKHSM